MLFHGLEIAVFPKHLKCVTSRKNLAMMCYFCVLDINTFLHPLQQTGQLFKENGNPAVLHLKIELYSSCQ